MTTGLGSRWTKFLVTGAAGACVQMCSLMLLRGVAAWDLMPATAAAVEMAILHNFFWNLRWTWAVPRQTLDWRSTLRLLWRYNATTGAVSIATSLVFTRLFMELFGLHYLLANLLAMGTGTLANFAAAEFLVFRTPVRTAARAGLILVACLRLAAGPGSQIIDVKTEDFLRRSAGFADRELAQARSGQRVVRTLDPGIPQEMVTVGVTRFEVPFDYFLERARKGDLYRVGPTLLEIGRFSATPTAADLAGLTLEGSDLEPFGELDPAAGHSALAAKEILVRLIRNYQTSGIRSLEPVQQGSKRLVVAGEVRALLAHSPYLRHYGAHLEEYVANYPLGEANGASEYFSWAKVNIGLKRLVRLTKVTVWELENGPRREAVMVTEQVFASRYFQASLQVDHVISDRSDAGAPAIRLVTVNRGRCDLLNTSIARLLRPLIISRTRVATQRTLDLAKTVIESEYQRR
jgi:dolichol-phosphate mannosyltransferase